MGFPPFLEPEDATLISPSEHRIRRVLALGFRFALAVFTASHLFDFMFSSIWMHGYVWTLNLPIDLAMTDKPAGALVRHQLDIMGHVERTVQAVLIVIAVIMLLLAQGFAFHPGKTTWNLMKISSIVGLVCGLTRPVQLQQRFFSSLHEGFYIYFMVFVVSFVLTFQIGEKFEKKVNEKEKSVDELKKTE